MSELNETTNPTADAEPILPVEPEAAAVLDGMNQTIESAATDVKAAGDELAAAAGQVDVLPAASEAAPVSSAAPEALPQAAPSPDAVFTLPTLEEPVRPQAAAVNPAPAPSYDVNADDKLMSALAWAGMVLLQIPLVSIVLLLAEGNKDRPFQRHHALQSIGFYLAALVYEVIAAILVSIGTVVTLGCGLACLWVLFFVPHALAIYYGWQAYQGREVSIPVVTQIMRQQGWIK
ncbi:DUF4870 domain-containing protein [Candidatus Amarolinea aalborgensis]|uniref:DUF4870 domain-containing protein n=1 Tax=Candidatus Amarolinea aalborgensis TaxID=2249329 RepID=UPI003BFA2226